MFLTYSIGMIFLFSVFTMAKRADREQMRDSGSEETEIQE